LHFIHSFRPRSTRWTKKMPNKKAPPLRDG
jgi:hypothetical protein